MNCRKSEQLIQDSLDGLLSAAERSDLDKHLSGCQSCRAAFDEYRRLAQSAKAWTAPESDDPVKSAAFLAAVLDAAKSVPQPLPESPQWPQAVLVFGVVATVAAAAYFEPSVGVAAGQISLSVHPLEMVDAFLASVRALPGDALQAANDGMNATPTHLPLDVIAIGAVTVNGLLFLRALLEGKRGGTRRVNG